MPKKLKLTQEELDQINRVVDLVLKNDELNERYHKDDVAETYACLFTRGFEEQSHEIIDLPAKNYDWCIKVSEEYELGNYYIKESVLTVCNKQHPVGYDYYGYWHKLTIKGLTCYVYKWLWRADLDIYILFKKKLLVQCFYQKLIDVRAEIYSYINSKGKLVQIDHCIKGDMHEPFRHLLRKDEYSIRPSRICDAYERLSDGACYSAKRTRYSAGNAVQFINDFCDNVMGGFAVRFFDAEREHGEASNDAKREHDLAKEIIEQLTNPYIMQDKYKGIDEKVNDLIARNKAALMAS